MTSGGTKDLGGRIRAASRGLRLANFAMDRATTADEFTLAQREAKVQEERLVALRGELFSSVA